MKTTSARLVIEVLVHCPCCDAVIDLCNDNDTDGYYHDDDSYILKQALPEVNWSESHEKFVVDDVTCSQCKETFNVKSLEW